MKEITIKIPTIKFIMHPGWGVYWDKKNKWFYILILPTIGIVINFGSSEEKITLQNIEYKELPPAPTSMAENAKPVINDSIIQVEEKRMSWLHLYDLKLGESLLTPFSDFPSGKSKQQCLGTVQYALFSLKSKRHTEYNFKSRIESDGISVTRIPVIDKSEPPTYTGERGTARNTKYKFLYDLKSGENYTLKYSDMPDKDPKIVYRLIKLTTDNLKRIDPIRYNFTVEKYIDGILIRRGLATPSQHNQDHVHFDISTRRRSEEEEVQLKGDNKEEEGRALDLVLPEGCAPLSREVYEEQSDKTRNIIDHNRKMSERRGTFELYLEPTNVKKSKYDKHAGNEEVMSTIKNRSVSELEKEVERQLNEKHDKIEEHIKELNKKLF